MAGDQLPSVLLSGVLNKSKIDGNVSMLAIVNLTPYDAWLEKFAQSGLDKIGFKTLSLTKHLNVAQYVERTLAIGLLQELTCCTAAIITT